MKPWYATNARDLLANRQHGYVPDGPVAVTLVDGIFGSPVQATLYARPDMPVDRMDWRMLVNLNVWLIAGPKASLTWLLETAKRIAAVRPQSLVLRFEQSGTVHDVEIGTALHLPAVQDLPPVHRFDWTPINCCGTATGAKLRQALLTIHPARTTL